MKNTKSLKMILILFVINLLLIGCSTVGVDQPSATQASQPTEEEVTPPFATLDPQTDIEEPIISARFTIQADDALKSAIVLLYQAYFQDESPVFVDEGSDLIAVKSPELVENRPEIFATFLTNAVFVPQKEMSEIQEFVDFSISPEGQQVLIDADELPSSVVLTDQAGKSVEIKQPIYRVISAYGPATAFIYSLDAEDRLVSASYLGARDPLGAEIMGKMDPRFPGIMGDDFFTQQDFNVEHAASLDPDLIITSARTSWLDTVEQIDLPLFLYDAETPERLIEAMLLTGQLFGPHPSAQAEAWVAYYEAVVKSILEQTSEIPEEERPRVLFTGTDPLRVASGEMYQTDIIEAAGGISVSAELTGYWNDINLEQVVIWDPDIIIVPPYGGASVEAITESQEWQILEAVQAGRVYRMPKLVVPWDTPVPDSILGIVWLAQQINPDKVYIDCSEEAEYFYNTFYNYAITTDELASICQNQ